MFNYNVLSASLREAGYDGSLNDSMYSYFQNYYGITRGQLNDLLYYHLGQLGYTGSLSDRMSQWDGTLFSPILLFTAGEQGAWYDPSDLTSMFQDSAGTTPVTAVGQPVGLMLDKSGRGNHATQSTAAARPVLSARVNLLTYSEQFDNAAWVKGGADVTITLNTDVAPDGTTAADRLTATSSELQSYTPCIAGVSYTLSLYIKKTIGATWFPMFGMVFDGGTLAIGQGFLDTNTGVYTNRTAYPADSATVQDAGSYWRVLLTKNSGNNIQCYIRVYASGNTGGGVYVGGTQNSVVIWGAQLETGSTATRYQRIAAATDYDTVGFPRKVDYDGIDDLLTASNPALGTNVTIARATASGASILTGQTVGANYVDNTDHYGLILINRALTSAETVSVTAYLNMKAGL